jgi:hypothetical protein
VEGPCVSPSPASSKPNGRKTDADWIAFEQKKEGQSVAHVAAPRYTMKGRHPVANGGARHSSLAVVRPRVSQSGSVLIYERENKPCFSLELSHTQLINYSLHIVDIFHISCHDISIVITSLVTRTTHIYSNTICRALLLNISCVYRHLTVF